MTVTQGEKMTKEITARSFFKDFLQATNDIDMTIYKNTNKKYTDIITEKLKDILTQSYGLGVNKEYYRIDVFGWKTRRDPELVNTIPEGLWLHLWQPIIAIEHENNHTDWTDELPKLLFINCPLKVIIGYNHWDKRNDSVIGDEKKLEYAAKVICKLSPNDNFKSDFLIIFGNCWGIELGNKYDEKDYRGYLLTNGKFEQI